MSKKRNNSGQRTFDAFRSARAIPSGYYSGDKPNPNLRSFVAQKSTPYDPENDDYDILNAVVHGPLSHSRQLD